MGVNTLTCEGAQPILGTATRPVWNSEGGAQPELSLRSPDSDADWDHAGCGQVGLGLGAEVVSPGLPRLWPGETDGGEARGGPGFQGADHESGFGCLEVAVRVGELGD